MPIEQIETVQPIINPASLHSDIDAGRICPYRPGRDFSHGLERLRTRPHGDPLRFGVIPAVIRISHSRAPGVFRHARPLRGGAAFLRRPVPTPTGRSVQQDGPAIKASRRREAFASAEATQSQRCPSVRTYVQAITPPSWIEAC